MTNNQHPSLFALDSFVAGATTSRTMQEHVASCLACQQHMARVRPDTNDLPAWVHRLPVLVPPPGRQASHLSGHSFSGLRARLRGFWLPVLATAPALAIAVFLLMRTRPDAVREPQAYVGIKSAGPMVWAYIKRGNDTFLWDGSSKVLSRDLLRLKIDAMNHTHISAFGRDAAGGWQRLWDGPVQGKGPTTLPVAWQIDSQPGDERILLVLSDEAVRSEELSDVKGKTTNKHWWQLELVFPKGPASAPRGSDDLH